MRLRRSQLVHIDFMYDTTLTLKYGIKVLDINTWKVSKKFTGVIIQAEKRSLGGICNEK